MTTDERRRFAVMITGIAETLGQEMTTARITGLLAALDDVPWTHLEEALIVAHRTARFVPSPGELRELAKEAAQVAPAPRPLLAADRTDIALSWLGRDEEVKRLLGALPKPPQWPEDGPDFKGYTEAVARRMRDMHAPEPTIAQKEPDARADEDTQGGRGPF